MKKYFEGHIKIAEFLTEMMDNKFKVGNFRFGFDPVLGLIPGMGDFISFIISFYLVWIGVQMRIPQGKVAEMMGNVIIDFLIGIIPVFGDLLDIVHKANVKNLQILKQFAEVAIVEGEMV